MSKTILLSDVEYVNHDRTANGRNRYYYKISEEQRSLLEDLGVSVVKNHYGAFVSVIEFYDPTVVVQGEACLHSLPGLFTLRAAVDAYIIKVRVESYFIGEDRKALGLETVVLRAEVSEAP